METSREMENSVIVWKTIPGFENYEMSTDGEIRSLHFNKFLILKPWLVNGYLYVKLYNKDKYNFVLVHRMHYLTFIGKIPKGYVVHHINGDSLINTLDNYVLMTSSEHCGLHHKYKKLSSETKLKMSISKCGNHNAQSKLSVSQVKEIKKLLLSGLYTQQNIAKMFSVSIAMVSLIKKGKRWNTV